MKKKTLLISLLTLGVVVGCNQTTPPSNTSDSISSEDISSILSESNISDASSEISESSEVSLESSSEEIKEVEYKVVRGSIDTETEGELKILEDNSMAVNQKNVFSGGTLSMDIQLSGSLKDNGIVFGLSNVRELDVFWEDVGVSYYFFFISQIGTAHLGKIENGSYTVCYEKVIDSFNRYGKYNVGVSWDRSNDGYDIVRGFINGEQYFSYKDTSKLAGEQFGVRAGGRATEYSNISVSSEITGTTTELDNYQIATGDFILNNDKNLVSNAAPSMVIKQDDDFGHGTLSVDMKLAGIKGDNGIVFGLENPNNLPTFWEANVSYYFFFISQGQTAYLGKVTNGAWSVCSETPIASLNLSGTYNLKVERDSTYIKCYIDNQLYLTYVDNNPLSGTGYGLRSANSGITYSNLSCESTGIIEETPRTDMELVSGGFVQSGSYTKAKYINSAGVINDKEFSTGKMTVKLTTSHNLKTGVIFNYLDDGLNVKYYLFAMEKGAQKMSLYKVVNGVYTKLFSNYSLFYVGSEYQMDIVIEEGTAYCYFFNGLYAKVDLEWTGAKVGFHSDNIGSVFSEPIFDETAVHTTVDTLLFGHSYFELWSNYRQDLASISDRLGSYTNIGIGGSVAEHWLKYKEIISTYEANRGIYYIGINDLTFGTSPELVKGQIEELALYLKEKNPNFELILLGTNHCPARTNIRTEIIELNNLVREMVAKYDWISYGELEEEFCDSNGNPISSLFSDGLHLTASSYSSVVDAIVEALDGVNQPTSSGTEEDLLNKAKELKKIQISDYSQNTYRIDEWANAESIYNSCIELINACTTVEEVQELDLSSYINQLAAIKNNSDYTFDEMMTSGNYKDMSLATGATSFSGTISSSQNGVYKVRDYGYRLDNLTNYTDMTFDFSIDNNTGVIPTGGVFFRATQTANKGVTGYLINFITDKDIIQVYYIENLYNTNGSASVCTYIGGWISSDEIEGVTFKAIVEGNDLYLYSKDNFLKYGEEGYSCHVDLTNNNTIAPITSGYHGVLCWAANIYCEITIDNLGGSVLHQ